MEKYIKGIRSVKLGDKISGGSCSEIYEYNPLLLFKMFNYDYRNLGLKINKEFLENLLYLSSLSDMEYVITPIDIFRSKTNLYGYTMRKLNALPLEDVDDNNDVLDLVNGFKKLKNDILLLSSNGVKTEDIGGDNILFNKDMYLIDLDLSLIDSSYDKDMLFSRTSYSVFYSLLSYMVGKISENDGMNFERKKLKNGDSIDFISYFDIMLDRCCNALNKKDLSVSDVRKVYKKTFR